LIPRIKALMLKPGLFSDPPHIQQCCLFFLDGDDRLRLIDAPRFTSGRKAAFSRLALARSACKGLIAAFSGPRGRG